MKNTRQGFFISILRSNVDKFYQIYIIIDINYLYLTTFKLSHRIIALINYSLWGRLINLIYGHWGAFWLTLDKLRMISNVFTLCK